MSGLSGAGKSVAIKSFEDIGYYCVDNLPAALIPTFADLIVQSKIERVALGIDVRERDFFAGLFDVLEGLQKNFQEMVWVTDQVHVLWALENYWNIIMKERDETKPNMLQGNNIKNQTRCMEGTEFTRNGSISTGGGTGVNNGWTAAGKHQWNHLHEWLANIWREDEKFANVADHARLNAAFDDEWDKIYGDDKNKRRLSGYQATQPDDPAHPMNDLDRLGFL